MTAPPEASSTGAGRRRRLASRRLAALAALAAVAVASAPAAGAAARRGRPNVVLVMADDQGWGETGYNGHPHLRTPVLDEMAAGGLRFDRFYAAAPACSPTRASVLTGRHPNRAGVFNWNFALRPEEVTLPALLTKAGYRTAHFGKWHLGPVKAASPVSPGGLGFRTFLSHDNFFDIDPWLSRNGADPARHEGEGSAVIVDAAIEFIRKAKAAGRPFLIALWYGSPHTPYSGLERDVALYGKVGNAALRHRFAEITAMDRSLGRLRKALREMRLSDNTLVWYTSDNGIPVRDRPGAPNAGLRDKKGTLYEGGLRVPAIIEWPAVVKRPRATGLPAVTSDILPTLLDILSIEHPAPQRALDGISLRPLIADGAMKRRDRPIGFWIYDARAEEKNGSWMVPAALQGTSPMGKAPPIRFRNHRHPVARTGRPAGRAAWLEGARKLVVGPSGGVELFDLAADPGERTDIVASHPDLVTRMRGELEAWQRSVERSLTGADYR